MNSPHPVGSVAQIRPFQREDQPKVVRLLNLALGPGPSGTRDDSFFEWKHLANPFGRSFMLVAEIDNEIVGFRSFLRWTLASDGQVIAAVRAVDTATHPDYLRRGIFARLTKQAIADLGSDSSLIFNTPNPASKAGYLKMGWSSVGGITVLVRPHRPLRLATGLLRGGTATARPPAVVREGVNPAADPGVLQFVASTVDHSFSSRWHTQRSIPYLEWRYGPHSGLGYQTWVARDGGKICAAAILRTSSRRGSRETVISELALDPAEGQHDLGSVITSVARMTAADHVVYHAASPLRGLIRSRLVPIPNAMALVVNQLATELFPDPTRLDSWGLSLGDLEIF